MRYPRVDMEGLTTIVAVAETGDIVAAGHLLSIGPSAVLKRLAKAEESLSTKIFRKTRHGIVLTPEGRAYHRDALLAIEHAVLAEEKVGATIKLREGRLLVGHSIYLPPRLLAILAQLAIDGIQDGPHNTKVERRSGTSHAVEHEVVSGQLHVGIGFLPGRHTELSVHLLIEEPIVLCMPTEHPLSTKAVIRPEDLEQKPIIAVGRQPFPALHEEIAEFYRGFGLDLRIVCDAYGPPEALSLVEQRMGICFLARSSALHHRDIITKPLATRILTRKCGIFSRKDSSHPMIRRFARLVIEKTKQARL
jgi:DNA-binding transcriptional LysR family regulator